MELLEAVEKRSMLEAEILRHTSEKCDVFEKETGLYISDIYFNLVSVSELGERLDKKLFTGCTVTVNI